MYRDGKKQIEENIIRSIRNLLKLKKENELIKERIMIDIGQFFNKNKKKIIIKH